MASLSERLRQELWGKRVIVLCLGSDLRGDDAAGLMVCDQLSERGLSDLVIRAGLLPEAYIPELRRRRAEVVLMVDAIDAGLPPGSVVLAEPPFREAAPATTTHGLPLDAVAALIQGEISDVRVLLLGIQIAQTEVGSSVSPPVSKSARLVADLISQAL